MPTPSRKKAKGKARKAARAEAQAKTTSSNNQQVQEQKQEQELELEMMLDSQTTRLQIEDLLECKHGYVSSSDELLCREFVTAFLDEYNAAAIANNGQESFHTPFVRAREGTLETYSEVWSDPTKLELVVSYLLADGIQQILEGNIVTAGHEAAVTNYFEQHMALHFYSNQAAINAAKIYELILGDEHTIVRYFKKRIPCSCLDEKYDQVKSTKKMGYCYNHQCSRSDRTVERSKMLCCTRCGFANYCSKECQAENWPHHRKYCDHHISWKQQQQQS